MPFAPGTSGNPLGRATAEKLFRPALISLLREKSADGVAGIHRVARKVMAMAEDGDMRAVEFIAERVDGKVPQAIVGDEEHPPVMVAGDGAKILGLIIEELRAKQIEGTLSRQASDVEGET